MSNPNWLGVLGFPLTYSKSKGLHEQNIKRADLNLEFKNLEWELSDFEGNIKALKEDPTCRGFSVTMPYKQRIVPYIEELDTFAKLSGVVNCVKRVGDKWHGFNTDGSGFLSCFRNWNPKPPIDTKIIFIGAGAIAQTLSITLTNEGYRNVTFINRNFRKACEWGEKLKMAAPTCDVHVLNWSEARPEGQVFLLNCTPLGMEGRESLALNVSQFAKPSWVFDVTYMPQETRLIQESRKQCLYTMTGWPMFQAQAEMAFKIWTEPN